MARASKRAVVTWTSVTVAATIATGGIALASQPSTPAVIHGCVSKATGQVRIAGHCTAAERAVSWNQQGPSGSPGVRGVPGPTGSSGPSGPPGATGPSGPAGTSGPSGPAGTSGPSGPAGPSGPVGPTGGNGSSGPTGPAGPTGPSDAWVVTNTTPSTLSTTPGGVLGSAPSLPGDAGGTSYTLSATVDVLIPGSNIDGVSVTCTLSLNGTTYSDTLQVSVPTLGQPEEGTLYLAIGATITTAHTPGLTCAIDGGLETSAIVQKAELTATQVGTLH